MATPTGITQIGKPGGLVEPGIQKYGVMDWISKGVDAYKKYKPLVDTAVSLGKGYLDYKSQKELNELSEQAYKDYMAQKQAAAQEAQAAIDLNLMPMEVTNIPTKKADVSDFTAVAARGGLMNLPTRQRKRYAFGPGPALEGVDISTIEEMDTPFDPREEGVNIGEQVFHDTGDARTNAQQVWQSGQIDQGLYQMDFEIFFQSGDWQDHISRGTVQGDMQMAKGNFNNPPYQPTEGAQDAAIQEIMAANGGIIGLRHGGRPGYQFGIGPQQGLMPQGMMPQGRIGYQFGSGHPAGLEIMLNDLMDEGYSRDEAIMIIEDKLGILSEKRAKGGRVGKDNGGIMNLGGLEKDYRTTGGFVPIGGRERADDVPARLSKNEFVMTADAVRAAGGGSINRGAQRMYDTMKHLEASPGSKRMTA